MDEHEVPWGRVGSLLFDEKQPVLGKKKETEEMKGSLTARDATRKH